MRVRRAFALLKTPLAVWITSWGAAASCGEPPAGTLDLDALADGAHKDSEVWFDFYSGGLDAGYVIVRPQPAGTARFRGRFEYPRR